MDCIDDYIYKTVCMETIFIIHKSTSIDDYIFKTVCIKSICMTHMDGIDGYIGKIGVWKLYL